jgi:hypothetical protein
VVFLGETPDLILQGLLLFLPTTLQITGVAGPYVHALEIAGKDLLDIFPAIDQVSGQVIEISFGCVGQVDGEKLNDKQVAIHLASFAREVVVL